MAQEIREVKHREHGRPRYQKGCQCADCVAAGMSDPCRCTVCVEANRAYSRRNKRLKSMNGGLPPEGLPPAPGIRAERDPDKLVETLVTKELGLIEKGAQLMPGIAATALAMARILDDPTSVPQHPGAARQLLTLMQVIRRASDNAKPASRLAGHRVAGGPRGVVA